MPTPRERMVVSTATLIRERGAAATSIGDVLEHSGAPRGSAYHYFPGGRAQLLKEATEFAAAWVAERLRRADSAAEVLDKLIASYRRQLVATDFKAGCPIVAVAVESESDLHDEAAAAFALWGDVLTERLVADGAAAEKAQALATFAIAAIEGALIMARARRDPGPLDTVHSQLKELMPQ